MTYRMLFFLIGERLDEEVYIEFCPDEYQPAILLTNQGESETFPQGSLYLTSL